MLNTSHNNIFKQPAITKPATKPDTAKRRASAVYWRLSIACFMLFITALTACGGRSPKDKTFPDRTAPILLFNGKGTSPKDVAALETILDRDRLGYSTVNSQELNNMSTSQLMRYRLLIIPGGDFMDMGNGITTKTASTIRDAVQHGLHYLGICAGAFLAGKSAYYNGLNLTSGITFGFYAIENKGVRKAALAITSARTPTLDQYWQDGPQLTGWGAIVAKYPDGTAAVTEGQCGRGLVILSGIHAEAPEEWRHGLNFHTPVSADNAFATLLIRAALSGHPLPHY